MQTVPEQAAMIHWKQALLNLSDTDIDHIHSQLISRSFPAHSSIFEPKDKGQSLYIVNTGRIRLIYRGYDGTEFTTGVYTQGYVIGLISVMLGKQRFLAAETLEHTTLYELNRQKLRALMHDIPLFALNIAHLLAELAYASIQRSGPFATQSVAHRLAHCLSRLAIPENKNWIVQGLTQEDLAKQVGASRSWVNITLASMEEKKLIQRKKEHIEIPDLARLRDTYSIDH